MKNKRYLRWNFLVPLAVIGTLCWLFLCLVVMRDEWLRMAMFKGVVFCSICYGWVTLKKSIKRWFKNGKRKIADFFKKKEASAQ